MRCVHEAKLYEENSFVTLTYAEAHLPAEGQLHYEDFQKFMKRLRKQYAPKPIRFYMCGEYGERLKRPHFHACLFNHDFADKRYWATNAQGNKLYTSDELDHLWGKGHCQVGELNFQTAAYTARYCMKKQTGREAPDYYNGKEPEFNKMSLKPGIGQRFLEKWETDVYPRDTVVINGLEVQPPKYYDKLYKKKDPEKYEQIKYEREKEQRKNYLDNTPRRLQDKEIVTTAKIRTLKRNEIEL